MACASCWQETAVTSLPDHPLDPLTASEVNRTSACVRRHAAAVGVGALRFNTIMLQEPPKAALLAYEARTGPQPPRRALAWLLNPPHGTLYEAVVQLGRNPGEDAVLAWRRLEGVQPTTTPDDCVLAEEIIMDDPYIRKLLKTRYGIEDMELVVFDPWSLHGTPEGYEGRRLMQGFLYMRTCKADNEYSHPLDLCPLVDLNLGKVVHVDMYDAPAVMPPMMVNYHRDLARDTTGKEWREDIKPLNITQPEGPSFSVEGNYVRWQNWHMRVGFNAREGLVLHNVAWEDSGRLRPILHRASLAEMAVPYGDPHHPYVRKCAFDVGDYGMGFVANSLELGCDCLGHIKYFDGVVNNARGEALTIRKAICMHEEDAGMLWKHTDLRLNHVEVRRSRRLVLSMVSTFANYEYGMQWTFYQDGTINFEMKLTGILSTSVQPLDIKAFEHGCIVAPGVVAANHQHLFCVRLDPAIDSVDGGRNLVVSEVNADPIPIGPQNPYGNAFRVSETPLTSIHKAMRDAAPDRSRTWKIKNPDVVNPITGQPVAFKLQPMSAVPMLMDPQSLVAKRAYFASKHLFVTPYQDGQLFPSGDHVVQSDECLGLKHWTAQDAPLEGADPVIWYSFGVTHLPRLEDFPIMNVETVGFQLKPFGFFMWNPTLDVPPTKNAASRELVTPAARPGKGHTTRSGGGDGGGGGLDMQLARAHTAALPRARL